MAAFVHLEYETFNVFNSMEWYMLHREPFMKDGLIKSKISEIILIPAITSGISKVRKSTKEYSFDSLVIGSGRECINPKNLNPDSFLEFKKKEEAKGLVINHFNSEYFNECLSNFKVFFEKTIKKLNLNKNHRMIKEFEQEIIDISDVYQKDNSETDIVIFSYDIWSFSLTYLEKNDWITIYLAFTNEADAIEAQNRILSEIDDFYLNYKDYVALNLLKGLSK